jgi:hypothetical protein
VVIASVEPFYVLDFASKQLRISEVFLGDKKSRTERVTIRSVVSIGNVIFPLQDDRAIDNRKCGNIAT